MYIWNSSTEGNGLSDVVRAQKYLNIWGRNKGKAAKRKCL